MERDNTAFILKLIYETEGISRLGLSKQSGITQAGITKIVKRLMEAGIVSEIPAINTTRGRPEVALCLNKSEFVTIGLRLNRNYIRLSVNDLGGHQIEQNLVKINASGGAQYALSEILSLITKSVLKYRNRCILGIGLAVPGPFLVNEQKILLMTGFNGWNEIDLKREIEQVTELPVQIEHDALCGALNEYYYEDRCKSDTIIFVAADRGVGSGILINGKPFQGSLGTAGEFGHTSIDYEGEKCVCGNRGCLELFCSTNKIVQRYGDSDKSAAEILLEAKNNSPRAKQIVEETGRYLGFGIVNLINTVNPQKIVISDTLAIAGELLYRTIDQILAQRLLPDIYKHTKLIVREPDKDYILWGANALVLSQLFHEPNLLSQIRRKMNYATTFEK